MNNFRLFPLIIASVLFSSCGNELEEKKIEQKKEGQKEQLINLIQRLEGEMHRSLRLDNVLAGQAIQAYDDYHKLYPDDSVTADYLFKAAEIATALKQYDQALGYYQAIIEEYDKYPLLQESYFLRATVWDHFKNDDAKAKESYEALLKEFPEGQYSLDAKAAIANLGKTDEELIREFEKKNKGK